MGLVVDQAVGVELAHQVVRHGGWIEIGDQEASGFVARALDAGGLVYEDSDARTLDEAMMALERGISGSC